MKELKFRFVYEGTYRIHYKWYYLDQLIDKSLKELSDIHHQMKLIGKDQYTGLKDKNGKEIYENDIVKIPDDWDEYGFNAGEKYQVYFAYGGFRLKPKYQKKAKGFYLEDDKIEVVGNIYKNSELLNAK